MSSIARAGRACARARRGTARPPRRPARPGRRRATVPAPTRISGTSAAIARDRLQRDRRAQGQLDDRQAAGDERAGERHGVRGSSRTTTGMTGARSSRTQTCWARGASSVGAGRGRKMLAPVSAGADGGAEAGEQLAAGAGPLHVVRRAAGRLAAARSASDSDLEQAGVGVDGDQVAVAHPGERAAERGLGRDVDGGRDLARRAGHAAVGDQRDPLAAVLQHAERRASACAARACRWRPGPGSGRRRRGRGRRAGPREGGLQVGLVVEDPRGRLDHAVLGLHRGGLDHRAAEAARPACAGRRRGRTGRGAAAARRVEGRASGPPPT